MCILIIRSWPCGHSRCTSTDTCMTALSVQGCLPNDCPHASHHFPAETGNYGWPCPVCTEQSTRKARREGARAVGVLPGEGPEDGAGEDGRARAGDAVGGVSSRTAHAAAPASTRPYRTVRLNRSSTGVTERIDHWQSRIIHSHALMRYRRNLPGVAKREENRQGSCASPSPPASLGIPRDLGCPADSDASRPPDGSPQIATLAVEASWPGFEELGRALEEGYQADSEREAGKGKLKRDSGIGASPAEP